MAACMPACMHACSMPGDLAEFHAAWKQLVGQKSALLCRFFYHAVFLDLFSRSLFRQKKMQNMVLVYGQFFTLAVFHLNIVFFCMLNFLSARV